MVHALQVTRGETGATVAFVDVAEGDLGDGEVLLDVAYSSLNFKDGLALRGDRGVARVSPLIPGIDVVGTVAASSDDRWRPGDEVVLTGAGLGETRNGGYARRARVQAESLVRVPAQLGMRRAAAIGTAGFTAAQAALALEHADIPEGDVVVTGATGGVGSVAVMLLAASGRRVVAATGHPDDRGYLERLGASELLDRAELQQAGKPLQASRWAGAVDVVGGTTLASLLAQARYGGAVAACGLVESAELATTVMPFILRGVSLVGINSVEAPLVTRDRVWSRLARDLDLALLDSMTEEIGLSRVPEYAGRILAGDTRGRIVVDVAH
ncbi:MDR family oxidoreductase [Protaetiibacter intestinalis]|uniref:Oxidoreductase n=1 Tax=Protaetiibacter intestinalis TaxID=2419774 RepID=A0A387B7X8_9MICO|nr:MDR family oxidoreductase [Protaetiibacter intestinalis]AYF97911.1 oxidoreductase [Protaetiibacter intestinalis]